MRPLTAADRDQLVRGFEGLSEAARYQRFFTPVSHLSASQLEYLTDIDHVTHFAWGVETTRGDGIGIARYVRTSADEAEAAFTIADDFQGQGLGWRLLQALAMVGSANGLASFEMTMLADNTAMGHLAKKAGAALDPPSGGTVRAQLNLRSGIWSDLPEAGSLLSLASAAATAA
jgi:RimJ/RimL family protein N-acetyltransferase